MHISIDIQRISSLGLGIEDSPGVAVSADVYLPFTENTLRGHHEPIENIASKASRIMDTGSVMGKRWAEGDVVILCDTVNSGYLWKLALGNELLETGTPNSHTFYTTVSGNTPKTATLINTRGASIDVEQYTYAAIDELTLEVADELMTLSASFMAKFPTAGSAQTPTTTSGTVLGFKDYFVQFGSSLSDAASNATTPINEFSLTIANNLEMIHRSGSSDLDLIRTKGIRITGSYTVFFDSETDKNAYYALNKRAMILTASGINNEQLRIRIPRFRINEADISTGLDDFYVLTADFVVEDTVDSGVRLIDVRLQNSKSTVY